MHRLLLVSFILKGLCLERPKQQTVRLPLLWWMSVWERRDVSRRRGLQRQGRGLGEASEDRVGVASCTRMTDHARNHCLGVRSRAQCALCRLAKLALPILITVLPACFAFPIGFLPSCCARSLASRSVVSCAPVFWRFFKEVV